MQYLHVLIFLMNVTILEPLLCVKPKVWWEDYLQSGHRKLLLYNKLLYRQSRLWRRMGWRLCL